MSSLLRAVAVAATGVVLGLSGCQGGGEAPDATATSVDAFPDVPHFRGQLAVRLQPALPVLSGGACEPAMEAGRYCSADGDDTFRALGEGRPATVVEVRTARTADHTAWDTVVRFDPGDRTVVRHAAKDAAGLGGVVLVLADGRLLEAVAPTSLDATRAHLLGLEKPEAWAVVESFLTSRSAV